ncbi:MAG: PQQ-dependent sugar dehydrogenase [Cytophagaceae bacterium]
MLRLLMLIFFSMLVVAHAGAQTFPAGFSRTQVAGGLTLPVAMNFAPDGRIFVTEQIGNLRIIKNGALLPTPAIHINTDYNGERGLLGVEFDPNFSSNHLIYLYYTVPTGTIHNRLSRFVINGDVIDPASEQILLDFNPLVSPYHNGGSLHFGPDGKLYVVMGENKVNTNSQDLNTYLGKILRINPDGSAPADNPFNTPGASESAKRIWAYGFRNPFSFAFQPGTGRLYVNDVGENAWEEINDVTVKGKNYGWPTTEGMFNQSQFPNFTEPVFAYSHTTNPTIYGSAITSGTFYNPSVQAYPSQYVGKYFFMDLGHNDDGNSWIKYIDPANPSVVNAFADKIVRDAVGLATGPDGNIYYLYRERGGSATSAVYKIVYTNNNAPAITNQPANASVPQGQPASFTVSASGATPLSYQWKKNGVNITGATAQTYTVASAQPADAGSYSVSVSNAFGSVLSNNASLTVTAFNAAPVAKISTPPAGTFYRGGSVISFSGTGNDQEDGVLPASAFSWSIVFHHNNHVHNSPPIATGATSGSYTVPVIGETEATVFYRLILTVTDSKGLKGMDSVDINPIKSTLGLTTSPAGLQVTIDGQPKVSPYSVTAVSGMQRTIGVVSPQTLNGTSYEFDHWDQGGPASQDIIVSDNNTTYNAVFRVSTSSTTLLNTVQDAYVRDGGSAATAFGATDATKLVSKLTATANDGFNRESYLTFNTASVTGSVASARVKVFGSVNGADLNMPATIYPVSNTAWTEGAITWNNKPVSGAAIVSTVITDATGRYYSWDVSGYVQAERAAGRNMVSFVLKSTTATASFIQFNSKETGANPPQIELVSTAPAPTAPQITTQPASQTVTQGQAVSFSVSASGMAPLSYQWQKDGVNITGATASVYSISSATASDAGQYKVTVSNTAGSSTSNGASLTVNPPSGGDVTLNPTNDAYVRDGGSAATNFGTTDATHLVTKFTGNPNDGFNRETYFTFDLSTVSGTISSVILKVYGNVGAAPAVPVAVYPVSNTGWSEATINWNNKPLSGAALSTTNVDVALQYYTWDVTAYVKSEKAAGRNIVSLSLKNTAITTAQTNWNSKESGTNPPQLLISTAAAKMGQMNSTTNVLDIVTYPNPARDMLNVSLEMNESGRVTISLLNASGTEISTKSCEAMKGSFSSSVEMSGLPEGLYILKIISEDKVCIQKIVKE